MATPAEHYAKADALIERISDMDPGLPIVRNLTAIAHVCALLATYTPPPEFGYAFRDGFGRGGTRIRRAKDKYL